MPTKRKTNSNSVDDELNRMMPSLSPSLLDAPESPLKPYSPEYADYVSSCSASPMSSDTDSPFPNKQRTKKPRSARVLTTQFDAPEKQNFPLYDQKKPTKTADEDAIPHFKTSLPTTQIPYEQSKLYELKIGSKCKWGDRGAYISVIKMR